MKKLKLPNKSSNEAKNIPYAQTSNGITKCSQCILKFK